MLAYTILYVYNIAYYILCYAGILYCTMPYYTVLHYTVLYCTILYSTFIKHPRWWMVGFRITPTLCRKVAKPADEKEPLTMGDLYLSCREVRSEGLRLRAPNLQATRVDYCWFSKFRV